jgi:DNA repair photolyase
MMTGEYSSSGPLVHGSKLTSRARGGVGKELSDGFAMNFAVGCAHGCPFCYVQELVAFGPHSHLAAGKEWGSYLYIRECIEDYIMLTKWEKYRGKEIMLSSTHDPYLKCLREYTRSILELALPEGVRFCIQTRSTLVRHDLQLLAQYPSQVRLQFSLATASDTLARRIEPRCAPPFERLAVLEEAHSLGIPIGVIIAPILPNCAYRVDMRADVLELARLLAPLEPAYAFAEALHARGPNLAKLNDLLGTAWGRADLEKHDRAAGEAVADAGNRHHLDIVYWPEHRGGGQ